MKLTVREAAKVLNVSETKIYRWVDEDAIPFVMIQHHPMFHRLELLEWAIETEAPLEADLYEHDGAQARPLTEALLRGGGHALGDGLASITAAMPVAEAERELIRSVIAAREGEMFSCREADRIAIPRARSPIIAFEIPPLAMLWWCERPLVFDGASADVVFVCVTPTIRDHLALLSRMMRALHDPRVTTAVRQPGAFDQVIAEVRRFERELAAPGGEA